MRFVPDRQRVRMSQNERDANLISAGRHGRRGHVLVALAHPLARLPRPIRSISEQLCARDLFSSGRKGSFFITEGGERRECFNLEGEENLLFGESYPPAVSPEGNLRPPIFASPSYSSLNMEKSPGEDGDITGC